MIFGTALQGLLYIGMCSPFFLVIQFQFFMGDNNENRQASRKITKNNI